MPTLTGPFNVQGCGVVGTARPPHRSLRLCWIGSMPTAATPDNEVEGSRRRERGGALPTPAHNPCKCFAGCSENTSQMFVAYSHGIAPAESVGQQTRPSMLRSRSRSRRSVPDRTLTLGTVQEIQAVHCEGSGIHDRVQLLGAGLPTGDKSSP